jgi:mono/diheme cytochrome c family protein
MRLAALIPLALAACAPQTETRLPTEADVSAARGLALFQEQDCASCHGAGGTGGSAPALTELGRGEAFPTLRVMAQIDGLGRHGDPDAIMPEFGARDLGDTVIVERDGLGMPVPADLLALTEYLRTIQE